MSTEVNVKILRCLQMGFQVWNKMNTNFYYIIYDYAVLCLNFCFIFVQFQTFFISFNYWIILSPILIVTFDVERSLNEASRKDFQRKILLSEWLLYRVVLREVEAYSAILSPNVPSALKPTVLWDTRQVDRANRTGANDEDNRAFLDANDFSKETDNY